MANPRYTLTAAEGSPAWNTDSAGTIKDRSPSWCVAFVRFKIPGAMFAGKFKDTQLEFAERELLVVENDCVAVNVTNTKASFAKTCTLTMKIGEVFYLNAVAPGDWVFVWMANDQDHIDKIVNSLLGSTNGTPGSTKKSILNNWKSGLKFMGRVLDTPFSDSISASGHRTLTQTVNCQAFLELASSIYYTFASQALIQAGAVKGSNAAVSSFYEKEIQNIADHSKQVNQPPSQAIKDQENGLSGALTNLSAAFLNFYKPIAEGEDKTATPASSPEAIIGMLFVLTMGIDADKASINNTLPGVKGTITDAIGIPASVGRILGRKGNKLWQMYNVCLGLQTYTAEASKKPWVNFSPIYTKASNIKGSVFYRTPITCKGYVPFLFPPIWDNDSYWNILNQFLNPIVNEMYTALRVNAENRIVPTLIIREKPFSTNLFEYLLREAPRFNPKTMPSQSKDSDEVKALRAEMSNDLEKSSQIMVDYDKLDKKDDVKQRTKYNNLPRWVINESILLGISISPSESRRINFVQVWGRSSAVDWTQSHINPETYKTVQFMSPNYVQDGPDIKRHGLRADISETNFDVITGTFGSISQILCRQRADWLFNGQLKPFGTITLQGIQEPIVEGDNLQVRGILFHIDSVAHSGSLDASGKKQFKTSIAVSNGIIAASLDTGDGIPQYPVGNENYSSTPSVDQINNLPGMVDIQNTGPRKGRDGGGEVI